MQVDIFPGIEKFIHELPIPITIHSESRLVLSNKAYTKLVESITIDKEKWPPLPTMADLSDTRDRCKVTTTVVHQLDRNLLDLRLTTFIVGSALVTTYQELSTEKLLKELTINYENLIRDRNLFMGVLGHELRTPVNYLFSGLKRVEQLVGMDHASTPLLSRLSSKLTEMSTLMENLLSLSRQQSGNFTLNTVPVTPAAIVADAIETVKHQKPPSMKIVSNIMETMPPVLADPIRIQEAVTNILLNAVKYSPPGSTVTVDCRLTSKSDKVKISIDDEGPGMTPAQIEAAQLPFARVQSNPGRQSGTGIGLTVASRIAELHGGPLQFRSRVGHGTCVSLTLLVAQPNTKEQEHRAIQQVCNVLPWPPTVLVNLDEERTKTLSQYLDATRNPHSILSWEKLSSLDSAKAALHVITTNNPTNGMMANLTSCVCRLKELGVSCVVHSPFEPAKHCCPNDYKFLHSSSCLATLVDLVKRVAQDNANPTGARNLNPDQ